MLIKRIFCSGIQKILERLCGSLKTGNSVYMFHQVNDDTNTWLDTNICITRKGFVTFIDSLLTQGYVFKPLNCLSTELEPGDVFITFDDIFSDVFENAAQYLISKKIPFCVFITENYIGEEKYISKEQLEILLKEPLCTVGFHTKNHILMSHASKKEIEKEMSPKQFALKYNCMPNYFAYPYGSLYACNFLSMVVAKRQKYRYCFCTLAIPVTSWLVQHMPFFLPRINVNESNYRKISNQGVLNKK